MEDTLTLDRQIAFRRNKYDYIPPPENTLNFAYEKDRFTKMSDELKFDDNILKLKILHEINEDFRDSSKMVQAFVTSDIVHVLVDLLVNKNNEIRELSSKSLVTYSKYFYSEYLN